MGDSKRRKDSDPNYGKSTLQPDLINCCNSAIAQEGAIAVIDFWTNTGGVAIGSINLPKLAKNQLSAYDLARQDSVIKLGLRRQQEQSRGALTIMDRYFRERELELEPEDGSHDFIFNWHSLAKIDGAGHEASTRGRGKAVVFGVVKHLIENCDPNNQFPCWFSGIPLTDNPNMFMDLIFVVDRRNPCQSQQDRTIISSETFFN
jgi:hypothetical protein